MARDLSREPLVDLLLAFDASQADVDLMIATPHGPARLSVRAGRIIDAAYGDARGAAALAELFALERGEFEVRETAASGEHSLDLSVDEALLQQIKEPRLRSGGDGSTVLASVQEPKRYAKTTPGISVAPRRPVGDAKTLLGFPQPVHSAPNGTNEEKKAKSDPPIAIPLVRTSPPARLAGPSARRPLSTGYSSAPPPALAEEHVALPRQLRGTPHIALAPANELRPSPEPDRTEANHTEAERAETGPVPSSRLDQKTLERLEALHEGISGTSHPAPTPTPDPEAWPPAAPAVPPATTDSGLPRVGRYEILARLKSGGMGSIYLCQLSGNAGFRRLFAMKVLHRELAEQDESLDLFFREANLLSQLHHPNVVGIVDVGSVEQPYLVLDYVEGGSLHELLRATPGERDPAAVIALVLDALHGLAAAHGLSDENGQPLHLVHNDISPQNLLVGVDGACRVTDFGVAGSRASDRPSVTRGKPSFMAPERLAQGSVDQRADLFSMGVVLYLALTGVDPFQADTAEATLQNVLSKVIDPPSEVGLRPAPALDWVVMKALSRDPAERFQTAEEMATQLRRIAMRENLLAAPSKVASWVRTALAPTLEARRLAAQSGGTSGSLRSSLPPLDLPNGGAQFPDVGEGRAMSEPPPSSGDFNDRTEVLSSVPSGPASAGGRRVLYGSIAAIALIVGWVLLFPERAERLFQGEPTRTHRGPTADEPSESDVPPNAPTAPSGQTDAPSDEPPNDLPVHVPAIRPRGEAQ